MVRVSIEEVISYVRERAIKGSLTRASFVARHFGISVSRAIALLNKGIERGRIERKEDVHASVFVYTYIPMKGESLITPPRVAEVISFVQEMTYTDKIPCAADVAGHFNISVQKAVALLNLAVKDEMVTRRWHANNGKYYYAYAPVVKERMKKKESKRQRLLRWLKSW